MKLSLYCTAIIISGILAGCSSSVPKCSDDETKGVVLEIVTEEMTNQIGAELSGKLKYALSAIRTTKSNEQTGAHECAAELNIIGPSETKPFPITYTVENTDDGNFYVNVFGL